MQLPNVIKEDGATDQALLDFAMQIQWSRAVGLPGGIVRLQLLPIALGLVSLVYYCHPKTSSLPLNAVAEAGF
jgi:hypothetical protein